MRLRDQVAIITGAGRGIGRAIALAYAREGAKLVLAARTRNELEETARQAQALGTVACVIPTNVSNQAQVNEMVSQTLERFSTIDILVNNAGILGPFGPLQGTDVAEWTRAIQVNLIGTYLCCQAVLPVMLRQNHGKIINLSGSGGANASENLSAYGSTKAAVVRLTEILSLELIDNNIQVNALGPGAIHTRMWEEMRDRAHEIGDAESYERGQRITSGGGASIEQAAELAVLLASPASTTLSGRLIDATRDDLSDLPQRIPEIMASEAYTLRRVELA